MESANDTQSGCRTLDVADGIALEDELLGRCASSGKPLLRLWQPRTSALVVPRKLASNPAFPSARTALHASGCPVLARGSGGDVVFQAPGMVNVEMALPVPDVEHLSVEAAYARICDPLIAWLGGYGLDATTGAIDGAFCDGRFNVNLGRQKIAGTAQRWRYVGGGKRVGLVHAIVLLDADVAALTAAVNRFYALSAIPRRCRAECHISLHQALEVHAAETRHSMRAAAASLLRACVRELGFAHD